MAIGDRATCPTCNDEEWSLNDHCLDHDAERGRAAAASLPAKLDRILSPSQRDLNDSEMVLGEAMHSLRMTLARVLEVAEARVAYEAGL